ncbi:MAG TPA: FtsX-like permease family protein [Ktedonobacterales bacterium]
MAGPVSGFRLAIRSAVQGWRLLTAVALGMVMTVTLLAVVPIYATLVSNTQIAAELAAASPSERSMEVTAHIIPFWQAHSNDVDRAVMDARTHDIPSGVITSTTEYLEVDRPFTIINANGRPIGAKQGFTALAGYTSGGQLDFLAFNYAEAMPHMKMIAGRLPRVTPAGAPAEVLVTPAYGAKLGTKLTIQDSANKKRFLKAVVVGVWFPRDENDLFWNGRGFETVVPGFSSKLTAPPVYPLLFQRSAFESLVSFQPASPSEAPLGVVAHYVWFVGTRGVTVKNEKGVTSGVIALRDDLNGNILGANNVREVGLATRLDAILSQGRDLLGLLRLPLYSVAAQLVVMALLFIMTMVGLLVESQGSVIATLRSRGASMTQMLQTYIAQGVVVSALALVAGPLLAAALALFVIVAYVPAARASGMSISLGAALREAPYQQAAVPALAGAGLALVTLIVAVWQSARADALAYRRRQGRPDQAPFWRRYYLDLGLAALVIAGYSQLALFGAPGARAELASVGATGSFDLIQTFTPALMLVVGALLILRVTPWLLRLGAWLAARGRGVTGMLALSHATRASSAFNRIVLLLALSVGVGLFTLSFQTALARSAVADAYYQVGADERVDFQPPENGTPPTWPFLAKFATLPGVRAVSPVYRSTASVDSNGVSGPVDLLAIDPATFAQTAAWNPGDAKQPLATLLARMQGAEQGAQAGQASHPIPTLVSEQFVQSLALLVGDTFQMAPQESQAAYPMQFVIVGVVSDFPTLFNEYASGFVIPDVNDYVAALANPNLSTYTSSGPNEVLMRTAPGASAAARRARALSDPNYFVADTLDARRLAVTFAADPLSAGMTGLLVTGAWLAWLFALVALFAQIGIAARQRMTQFAVLRTLGLGRTTLLRTLLGEQAMMYVTGAFGGVALSALLDVAALPFLAINSSTYLPPVIGVPAPALTLNVAGSALFLAGLLAMFGLALLSVSYVAQSSGLGQALRVGED